MKKILIMALLTIIVTSVATLLLVKPKNQSPSVADVTVSEVDGTEQTAKDPEPPDYELSLAIGTLRAELADYQSQIAIAKTELALIKAETISRAETRDDAAERAVRIKKLGKLYASMKTNNAVTILSTLDESLSLEILTGMDNRTSSKLIDAIAAKDPDYAVRISEFIAGVDATQSSENQRKRSEPVTR